MRLTTGGSRQGLSRRSGPAPVSGVGRRRRLLAACVGASAVFCTVPAGAVHPDGAFVRAGNLVVYLAVVPAAIVTGHPPEHTGQGAHGGPPPGRYAHHLLVALFDAATGARIADATVKVTVHGIKHHPGENLPLEPMTVAGAAAYGGFVTLPARDFYRINVEVRRAGADTSVMAEFRHRHFQP